MAKAKGSTVTVNIPNKAVEALDMYAEVEGAIMLLETVDDVLERIPTEIPAKFKATVDRLRRIAGTLYDEMERYSVQYREKCIEQHNLKG